MAELCDLPAQHVLVQGVVVRDQHLEAHDGDLFDGRRDRGRGATHTDLGHDVPQLLRRHGFGERRLHHAAVRGHHLIGPDRAGNDEDDRKLMPSAPAAELGCNRKSVDGGFAVLDKRQVEGLTRGNQLGGVFRLRGGRWRAP